jgi:hypothetical protein
MVSLLENSKFDSLIVTSKTLNPNPNPNPNPTFADLQKLKKR